MSNWFDALEESWARGDTDDYGYDEHAEDAGEVPDDPSTWDLTSGRAAAYEATPLSGFRHLDIRELLTVIIDGVMPDGSEADDLMKAYALDVSLKSKGKRGKDLWRALFVAYEGEYPDGTPVERTEERIKAHELIDTARLKSQESVKDETGEIVFATGVGDHDPSRDERGRLRVVRTPGSDKKVKSVDKTQQLIEAECERLGLTLDAARQPFGPGRPSGDEAMRRKKVALVVASVRGHGVTLEAIGKVLGLPRQRVHELSGAGDQLLAKLTA